ncbi:MAG: hypothetical protein KJ915_10120 [Candidatus Omnitrophica bacterium]|nr:hypothetical protein [Candidatus Omnitrophota bacterium]
MTKLVKLKFKQLNVIFLITIAIIVLLVIAKQLIFAIIFGVVFISWICPFWSKLLEEELLVYHLKKNNGKLNKLKAQDIFYKKKLSSINRLIEKKIVIVENDMICLIDMNYITAWEKKGKGQ